MTLLDQLGARPNGDSRWLAETPPSLQGAFGGTFGGLLAALSVGAARHAAPGRVPFSLDCQFIQGLRGGVADISTDVVRSGRSMTAVAVTMLDGDRLATRATVLLADLDALDEWSRPPPDLPPPVDAGRPWKHPPGQRVGIIDTLSPRAKGLEDGAIATTITLPWNEADFAAEAACIAADLASGPPVEAAFTDGWRAHPNPDLSLRFLPLPLESDEIVGLGRLDGVASGIAMLRLAVWSGNTRIAEGAASSLISRPKQ